jgi:hypothetical protein
MRRASTCLAVLAVALTALTGVASAAPTVKFKATAVPISGYPHTGNIFGAGAAVQAEYKIESQEYGGFPPPLIGVNFLLPQGAKLHTAGFKTCPTKVIAEEKEPAKCPSGSKAGPVGHALGVVAFGTTRVPEETTIESFYAPGGGLNFFTAGHEPVSLEIPSTAKYVQGPSGFGPKLIATIPLVETVPGAPDASVESISVKVGSAMKVKGKPVYYGTMPTSCPKHYLLVKSELTFAGLGGLPEQKVTTEYHAPCPRKH